jgi:hypothetical protein
MADRPSITDAAQGYLSAGLCVLPASRADKYPTVGQWNPYQKRLPTEAELSAWFANRPDAICIVCGKISGNAEMMDFDFGGKLFDPWCDRVRAAAPGLLAKLAIENTQSDGWHAIYRCISAVCGSKVLARRRRDVAEDEITLNSDGKRVVVLKGKEYVVHTDRQGAAFIIITLIETRGEGGLFLCDPTAGYELAQGELTDLPVISEAERDILWQCARDLNEMPDKSEMSADRSHNRDSPSHNSHNGRMSDDSGHRPGDDYNRRGDVQSVLAAHGWTYLHADDTNEHWRRPGKKKGQSATLRIEDRTFYVFSSNAYPFEMGTSYSPFAVYAILEHDGDFSTATSALSTQGYGQSPQAATGVDISAIVDTAAACVSNNSHNGDCPSDNAPPIHRLKGLIDNFDGLNAPVIHGLLREGETMNIIASPKMGKSWFVSALAISIASGLDWLGLPVEQGRVLHIDNELHACTSAYRYGVISEAMGMPHRLYSENIDIVSLRGQLRDLHSMGGMFDQDAAGRYKLVIIDAFYRTLPRDTDENDNAAIASLYNRIDHYAAQLQCAFVLIHHASKGSQSGKTVTDVGAGAGSQSRAADTHLILRPHQVDDIVVLESAIRSWPPMPPLPLAWKWPLFRPTEEVDASALLGAAKPKSKPQEIALEDFVDRCIGISDPCSQRSVSYEAGRQYGLPERQADRMLDLALERGLATKIRIGSYMRYVKNRPGVTGDKALWTAALLAHDPDGDTSEIAETVGATRQYINQIRRSIFGNWVETDGN